MLRDGPPPTSAARPRPSARIRRMAPHSSRARNCPSPRQRDRPTSSAGSTWRPPPLPVEVAHPPGPARQQQHRRPVLAAGQEGRLVDEPQLAAAVQDGEQRRRGEDRDQVEEVLAAVGVLALAAQPEHARLVPEDLLRDHPGDDPVDRCRVQRRGRRARPGPSRATRTGRSPAPGGPGPGAAGPGCGSGSGGGTAGST